MPVSKRRRMAYERGLAAGRAAALAETRLTVWAGSAVLVHAMPLASLLAFTPVIQLPNLELIFTGPQ